MTTLAQEWEKQKRWRLKPRFAAMRVFDELLENEFRPVEAQTAWLCRALQAMVGFAVANTPYYTNLFVRLGLKAADIHGPEDLPRLPRLTKADVTRVAQELRSLRLPPGEQAFGEARSSGTTGRPLAVLHGTLSNAMFSILSHRSARWFGLDPFKPRVDVQPRHYLLRPDGSQQPDGAYFQRPGWRYLGQFFETGPEYAFAVSNPMEQQVAWLKELRPACAWADPGVFEEWLLANRGENPVDSLETLVGVGSQLTPSLRTLLEQRYAIPIQQVYGLNEIGIVGVRCEAGRYHTHAEHCLVEIVEEDGHPCPPGTTGRVLVTGLRNYAMPLLRYDTGDMAVAVDGACPCGRTLPSFGEIAGRYRRYAGLPAGTRERFQTLRGALTQHTPEALVFLRGYQIHQDRQNHFTLRLRTTAPIPEVFVQAIHRAWDAVPDQPPLAIVEVEEIATTAGGKLLDFISDFYTDVTVDPQPPSSGPATTASASSA